MKRMTYFVMALALVLGFTQCKKEQLPANNETEGVFITLDVNGGNNGAKVIVNPTGHTNPDYATVTFENGDVIYVGNNGVYCGYLEHNGTNFTGTVNPTSTDDYLHFYFMGNKGEKSQPTSVSITDQRSEYPVISYAHSTDKYSSSTTSYTAKLQNYCSIVKFTTNSIPTATAVTVKGMKNTVAVNFGANNAATSTSGSPYTFTKSGTGDIILHAVSPTERWAILLEQSAVNGSTVTATGYQDGTCDVPAISNNAYITGGDAVSISLTAAAVVGHALSVSVLGEVVGTDGLAYAVADKDNLPTGVTAAGMVAYKDGSNGLVIALTDEASTMDWSTAMGESGAAAHTPAVSGQTWKLLSDVELENMTAAFGGDPVSYYGLNTAIGDAGGTALQENTLYWTSVEYGSYSALHVVFYGGILEYNNRPKSNKFVVRACLAF